MHSWTMCLEVENDEYMLKARTRFFWSWNSWENFETKDDIWCSLALFETMFLKMELLRKLKKKEHKMVHSGAIWMFFRKLELLRKFWKQREKLVHSDAIWNGVLEVGTAEKNVKARKLNGALWCCMKRCFRSRNCLENFESKEAKLCILALFGTVFWNCFEKNETNQANWTLFEECGRLSVDLLNVEICSSLK